MLSDALLLLSTLPLVMGIHEAAHAYVAVQCGDHGPARAGRVTLNPFAHLDLIGSVVLPALVMLLTRGMGFAGYAKPVIIEPQRFRKFRIGVALCAAAGPLSNLLTGLAAAVLARLLHEVPLAPDVLITFSLLSLFMAAFNMVPLPPLDGSRVLQVFLPERLAAWCLGSNPAPALTMVAALLVVRFALGFDVSLWLCNHVLIPALHVLTSF